MQQMLRIAARHTRAERSESALPTIVVLMNAVAKYLQPALLLIGVLAFALGLGAAAWQMAEAWTPISGWVAGTIVFSSQLTYMAAWIPKNVEIEK